MSNREAESPRIDCLQPEQPRPAANLSRRDFLGGLAAGAGAFAALPALAGETPPPAAADADGFSFVHLTDMHVTPRRRGDAGYRRCVEAVLAEKPRPAFALMGGDLAFDGNYTPKADFEEQIRLYREITSGLNMPAWPCMGNHDALGWSARRKCAVDDPELGKKMIMDRLDWEKSYYSFDYGDWHFAVLDSIFPVTGSDGPIYEPRIGPEQLEWLACDLGAAGDRPKVAITHIAAFCNLGQQNGNPAHKAMDGAMVLWDTVDLRAVLRRHGVKALLQGHSHRIEATFFEDVWYLTSAAVSGAWWAGSWIGCAPGYTVFHCRGDQLTWEYRQFPWEPHLAPEDDLERRKIAEYTAALQEQAALREKERAGCR